MPAALAGPIDEVVSVEEHPARALGFLHLAHNQSLISNFVFVELFGRFHQLALHEQPVIVGAVGCAALSDSVEPDVLLSLKGEQPKFSRTVCIFNLEFLLSIGVFYEVPQALVPHVSHSFVMAVLHCDVDELVDPVGLDILAEVFPQQNEVQLNRIFNTLK